MATRKADINKVCSNVTLSERPFSMVLYVALPCLIFPVNFSLLYLPSDPYIPRPPRHISGVHVSSAKAEAWSVSLTIEQNSQNSAGPTVDVS